MSIECRLEIITSEDGDRVYVINAEPFPVLITAGRGMRILEHGAGFWIPKCIKIEALPLRDQYRKDNDQ